MKYQLGKQYFIDSIWYVCVMENASYALLEAVDKPSVTKMVRQ